MVWVQILIHADISRKTDCIGTVKHKKKKEKKNKKKKNPKITIIFLSIVLNMCFGCSKEPSHRDGSFEYPTHMSLRHKKNNFLLRNLTWGLSIGPVKQKKKRKIAIIF